MLGTSWDDPRTMATLAAAQALLGRGGSMQRLAGAGGAYGGTLADARTAEEQRQSRLLQQMLLMEQVKVLKARQEAERAAQERQTKDGALMGRLVGMPVESAMPAGLEGPGAPMRNRGVDVQTFLAQGGSLDALPQVQGVNQLLNPPPAEPVVSKPGDVARDPTTGDVLWENPEAPNMNALLIPDGKGGYVVNQALLDAKRQIAQAGATSVHVGTGQRDVNWGTPPKDYVWARDAAGQVMTERDPTTGAYRPIAMPIAGSKDAAERQEAGAKDQARKQTLSQQADMVLESINEAKGLVGVRTSGVGGLAARLPMTDARRLAGLITTIKANLGFDRLQQMRDMSPTGGALGQVAVQELNALQSTVAMLDQLQSPADVLKALTKIEGHYLRWNETLGGTSGGASGDWSPPSPDDIKAELRRRGHR